MSFMRIQFAYTITIRRRHACIMHHHCVEMKVLQVLRCTPLLPDIELIKVRKRKVGIRLLLSNEGKEGLFSFLFTMMHP